MPWFSEFRKLRECRVEDESDSASTACMMACTPRNTQLQGCREGGRRHPLASCTDITRDSEGEGQGAGIAASTSPPLPPPPSLFISIRRARSRPLEQPGP